LPAGLITALGLALCACPALPNPANAQTVEFAVTRMTCTDCDMAITAELENLEGVFIADADWTRGYAMARYDPAFVTPEQMIEEIGRLGYGAEVQETGGGEVSPVEVGQPEGLEEEEESEPAWESPLGEKPAP
jgi:copper chaperone CopZ